MRVGMYTIFDSVAQESGPVVTAKNDGIAMRMFLHTVRESHSPMDFILYKIGFFDTETMSLEPDLQIVDIVEDTKDE